MADDKTFTQAEMDSIIEGRLARERQKYADYDDLKEKASKYDEYQAQNKTELQKEKEKSDALQAKSELISAAIFFILLYQKFDVQILSLHHPLCYTLLSFSCFP